MSGMSVSLCIRLVGIFNSSWCKRQALYLLHIINLLCCSWTIKKFLSLLFDYLSPRKSRLSGNSKLNWSPTLLKRCKYYNGNSWNFTNVLLPTVWLLLQSLAHWSFLSIDIHNLFFYATNLIKALRLVARLSII